MGFSIVKTTSVGVRNQSYIQCLKDFLNFFCYFLHLSETCCLKNNKLFYFCYCYCELMTKQMNSGKRYTKMKNVRINARGRLHCESAGMLVVLLSGVNLRFWYHKVSG